MRATLLAIVFVVLLCSGAQTSLAQTATPQASPTPDPDCAGGLLYLQQVQGLALPLGEYMVELRFLDPDRDLQAILAPEWREMAELAEQTQSDLKALEPPPALEQVHLVEVDRLGLMSNYSRTAEREGALAANREFNPAFARLADRTDASRSQARRTCPELADYIPND